MFASRHAVFVGPGRLPKELRDVLLRRQGAPQLDLPVNTPRLLAIFDSAVEAERVSSQVQRLKITSVVAGPEQPAAEASWVSVPECVVTEGQPLLSLPSLGQTVALREVTRATVIDWREGEAVDRAMLLHLANRELYLRSSALHVEAQVISSPAAGLRTLTAVATELARLGIPVQTRKLSPAELGAPTLTGDLLPLALAVFDVLDRPPPQLTAPPPMALTPLDTGSGWGLALGGVALAVGGALSGHPAVAVAGLGLVALGVRAVVRRS